MPALKKNKNIHAQITVMIVLALFIIIIALIIILVRPRFQAETLPAASLSLEEKSNSVKAIVHYCLEEGAHSTIDNLGYVGDIYPSHITFVEEDGLPVGVALFLDNGSLTYPPEWVLSSKAASLVETLMGRCMFSQLDSLDGVSYGYPEVQFSLKKRAVSAFAKIHIDIQSKNQATSIDDSNYEEQVPLLDLFQQAVYLSEEFAKTPGYIDITLLGRSPYKVELEILDKTTVLITLVAPTGRVRGEEYAYRFGVRTSPGGLTR